MPDNPQPNPQEPAPPQGSWPPPSVSEGNRETAKELVQQTAWPPPRVGLEQHKAETASRIARWLLIMLSLGILLNYACIMVLILCRREDSVKTVEDVFHAWLPVIAGLLGGAVAFYYKEGK
jgi:hypothetical protein